MTKKMLKICFIFLILFFLLIQIYPVIWVFIASLKSSVELSINAFSLPKEITFENFVQVVKDGKILGYMWNSLKITAVSLVLIVGLSGTVGFSISKFRAKYNQKIY